MRENVMCRWRRTDEVEAVSDWRWMMGMSYEADGRSGILDGSGPLPLRAWPVVRP